jgi:hypothetical protein
VLEEEEEECWVVSSDDGLIERAKYVDDGRAKKCSENFSRIDQFMLVARDFSGTLNFKNSSLSHLPPKITELHKLTALDISNNDNIREVPKDLWKCKELKEVTMKDCEYSAKLLEALDSALDSDDGKKEVVWKNKPSYLPKLRIKFFTCAALFAMEIFTIYYLIKYKDEPKDDPGGLLLFKRLVAVLSMFLLLPHAVDVGSMMDQFLKVPFSGKIHEILASQEKLAENRSVRMYNMRGFLLSLSNAVCSFWCIRVPDDTPKDYDEELGVPDSNHSPVVSLKFKQLLYSEDERRLEWTRLFVIVVEWLDTVQTLALFPLSWFVITNSSTVIDVLVNVVAVSVFARLDDETVEMFTKPKQSLLDRWRLYTGSEEDLRRWGIITIGPKPKSD